MRNALFFSWLSLAVLTATAEHNKQPSFRRFVPNLRRTTKSLRLNLRHIL